MNQHDKFIKYPSFKLKHKINNFNNRFNQELFKMSQSSSQENMKISEADFLLGRYIDHQVLRQFDKNMGLHQKCIYQNNRNLFRNSLTNKVIKSQELFNQNYFDRAFIIKMFQKTRKSGQLKLPSSSMNNQQTQKVQQLSKGLNTNFPDQEQKWIILYRQRLYQLPDKGNNKMLTFKKNEMIPIQFTNQDKIFIQGYSMKKTQSNFKFIQEKIIDFNKKYKEALKERLPSFINNQKQMKKIYKFHKMLQQKIDDILYDWKIKEADFRICLTCSKLNHEDYYFYHKMQEVSINNDISGTQNIEIKIAIQNELTQTNASRYQQQIDNDLVKQIQRLKDLLLLNLINSKNTNVLQNKFQPMIRKFQVAQKDKILKALFEVNLQKSKKNQKFKSDNSFQIYNQINIRNFLTKWKREVTSSDQTQNSLCISMQKIYLNKSLRYKEIQCSVQLQDTRSYRQNNNNNRQYENQANWFKLLFTYKGQQESELIYELDREERQRTKWISLGKLKTAVIKINVAGKQNRIGSHSVNLAGTQNLFLQQKDNKFGDLKQINLYNDQTNDSEGVIEALIKIISHKKGRNVRNFDLQAFRNIKLLKNIGTLPPNYLSQTHITYSPQNFELISQLVGNNQATFSKLDYQKNYLHLVFFLQKSFNQAKRSTDRMYNMKNQNNSIKKSSKYFDEKCFFSIDQRFLIYKDIISKILSLQNIFQTKQSQSMQRQNNLINSRRIILSPYIQKSVEFSLQKFNPSDRLNVAKIINRALIYSIESSINFQNKFVFHPYLIPIFQRLVIIYKYKIISSGSSLRSSSAYSEQNQKFNLIKEQEAYMFSIRFLQSLYPYFNPKSLQKDLVAIRILVQKYLPQFNFKLNRQNIGLENLCSRYLLSFFAYELQEQITFRIWDFLLICPDKNKGRIISLYTLLIFLQKTNLLPIIPHYQFSFALYVNYQKMKLNSQFFQIVNQSIQSFQQICQREQKKKKQIKNLNLNQKKNNNIWNEYFVKKIVFSSTLNQRSIQNKNIKRINNANTTQNFEYKLPRPNYSGFKVLQVKLLIRSLYILETIAFSNKTYLVVKWQTNQSKKLLLKQKNQILNFYIKFQNQEIDQIQKPLLSSIQFLILEQDKKYPLFLGELQISTLHKDFVYNEQVRLIYFNKGQFNLSNKGQNILNVGIILKSQKNISNLDNSSNKNLRTSNASYSKGNGNSNSKSSNNLVNDMQYEKEYYVNEQKKKETIYDRFLDYSIDQDANDGVKEMIKVHKTFESMKNPLDQFGSAKYKNIKIPIANQNFPQFILNSALSIEELKAVFAEQFSQNPQYQLYLSPLYKIFSKSTNFQLVFLSQILIQILLLDQNVTLQQKLVYFFCIGKHYQNCGGKGKGLTTQTADGLLQIIFSRYGFLNSVSYFSETKGKIISAILYPHGQKIAEQGKNITKILQDWAHICKIKYGYYGVLLGIGKHLHVLRSLLPDRTLKQLLNSQNCRIQIIYQHHNKSIYLWSSTISTEDFKVIKFGTKFLQKYPSQRPLSTQKILIHQRQCPNVQIITQNEEERCRNIIQCDMDAGCQILYNAQNIINLEFSNSITFDQFKKIVYNSPLLCYLLNFSSNLQPNKLGEKLEIENNINSSRISSPSARKKNIQGNASEFEANNQNRNLGNMSSSEDLVLYRYQNCIERWRSCEIKDSESNYFNVQLFDDQKFLPFQLAKKYNRDIKHKFLYKVPKFQAFQMDENLIGIQDQDKKNNNNLREQLISLSPQKKKSSY